MGATDPSPNLNLSPDPNPNPNPNTTPSPHPNPHPNQVGASEAVVRERIAKRAKETGRSVPEHLIQARWMVLRGIFGITHYTTLTLHGAAMLDPSQPKLSIHPGEPGLGGELSRDPDAAVRLRRAHK